MERIGNILNLKLHNFGKYQDDTNVSDIDVEKTKRVINRLFIRLERILPKFWVNIKSQEHLNGIKDEWFECFKRVGMKDIRAINIGLMRAQHGDEEYLPKASTFIKWCKPSEPHHFGFPGVHEAYLIACKMNIQFSDYFHPDERIDTVIRHAINEIGTFSFREMNREVGIKTFETYYSIAFRQFIEGNITPIKKSLPEKPQEHPDDKERSDKARVKAMADIWAKLR